MSGPSVHNFHERWSQLKPPLRPNAEVVAAIRNAVGSHDARVLLLGVTPELVAIGQSVVAVDKSEKMIALIWPGDGPARRAVLGNWLDMPTPQHEFTAVIGDGSMASFGTGTYATFFAQLSRVLVPGAPLAVRIYETPGNGETLAQVRDAAMAGKIAGFHAFKWRLAMAVATEAKDATVPVVRIHQSFERAFPDRAALSAASGWTVAQIGEIDAYAGQDSIFHFPTRREILAALPGNFSNPRFATSGTYELAERCPILVVDFTP